MNPKTHAILKALGFTADETYAALGITDYVRCDKDGRQVELIAVYHTTQPTQIPNLIGEQALATHKRRVKELRAELERLER